MLLHFACGTATFAHREAIGMHRTTIVCCCLCAGVAEFMTGCRTAQPPADTGVTVAQIEELRNIEDLLPTAPDSIIERYRRYDRETFYRTFTPRIQAVSALIDSLNQGLDPWSSIDTLAIDHTFENFGTAARMGKTIVLSGSYFFAFDDPRVARSAVLHEYGHIYYEMLSPERRAAMDTLWRQTQSAALFYIFRDGEYSGNARFGGHPDESPEELYASAFNLFSSRGEELAARLQFVDPKHLPLIERLRRLVIRS
jgi:hypothetical protein